MEVNDKNSVDRLAQFLREMAKPANGEKKIRTAICEVLGFNSDVGKDLLSAYSHVERFLSEVDNQVRSIERLDHELFLKWMPIVRRALAPSYMNGSCAQFRSMIDGGVFNDMRYASSMLSIDSDKATFARIEPDEVKRLQAEAEALHESIMASGLDGALKRCLIDMIDAIRKSLLLYRLRCLESLREATCDAVGYLVLHYQGFSQEDRKQAAGFMQYVVNLSVILKAAELLQKLFGPNNENLLQ